MRMCMDMALVIKFQSHHVIFFPKFLISLISKMLEPTLPRWQDQVCIMFATTMCPAKMCSTLVGGIYNVMRDFLMKYDFGGRCVETMDSVNS